MLSLKKNHRGFRVISVVRKTIIHAESFHYFFGDRQGHAEFALVVFHSGIKWCATTSPLEITRFLKTLHIGPPRKFVPKKLFVARKTYTKSFPPAF